MLVTAGSLDHFVQFQKKVLVADGLGYAEAWENSGAPQPASKRDISDGERWRAGEVQAHVTTRFVIRSSTFARTVNPAWRLTCKGRVYDIFGIKELQRNRWIEITAAARNDG